VEASGRVTQSLDLVASFATGSAKVRQDTNASVVGNRLPLYPETTASLFATFRPEPLPGLSASFGLFYTGSRYESISNAARIPASTVVDAGLSYDAGSWMEGLRLQANVRNLFDANYYEPGNGNGNVFPGLRRRFTVSASFGF
jgi:outer membrane receptor protein involved in Fe transport